MIQRGQDGSVNFNRGWGEYEDGFGKLTGEFWYGLRALLRPLKTSFFNMNSLKLHTLKTSTN